MGIDCLVVGDTENNFEAVNQARRITTNLTSAPLSYKERGSVLKGHGVRSKNTGNANVSRNSVPALEMEFRVTRSSCRIYSCPLCGLVFLCLGGENRIASLCSQ